MTIHLGYGGSIQIARESAGQSLSFELCSDDVNVGERRFSVDFDYSLLRTGDRVAIQTTDRQNLQLLDQHEYPDALCYVHVDEAGGIRLYRKFFDALNGDKSKALPLMRPLQKRQITFDLYSNDFRCLAQVQDYEFTTTRSAIDITKLGDEFRESYANGLIAGQGTATCFWDYKYSTCGDGIGPESELPHYLAQLILRTQLGSSFLGKFFLHRPTNKDEGKEDFLFYEARCIITNCVMAINPSEPVMTKVDFITTGEFKLKSGIVDEYLLQESGDKVLQEDESGILLEA